MPPVLVPAAVHEAGLRHVVRGLARGRPTFLGHLFLLPATALLLLLPLGGQPVSATTAETAVFGTVRGPDRPVEGIRILVERDGEQVGEAFSDGKGAWRIPLPEAGTYTVRLDPDTLPEGLEIREPDRFASQDINVASGQAEAVLFPIVTREPGVVSFERLRRFMTLFISGIQLGAVIAITAVGLSLIFGVTGLVNFAHGEMVTFGAVLALFLNAGFTLPGALAVFVAVLVALSFGAPFAATLPRSWGRAGRAGVGATVTAALSAGIAAILAIGLRLHVTLAAVVAVLAGGGMGFAMERGLFGPLRRRRVGLIALLMVSIGLSIVIRYLVLMVLGAQSHPYIDYTIQHAMNFGPFALTPKELAVTVLSLAVLVLVGLLLTRTQLGTAMRAVADNRDLAESSGIDVQRVILAVWIGGGALAAYGGVMQGLVQSVTWDMGFKLLLLMFAGVILGGLGTAFGAMVGGLVIGVVTQVSTLWFSVEMKLVFAFAVLIAVLLVRPQGILGRRERIG